MSGKSRTEKQKRAKMKKTEREQLNHTKNVVIADQESVSPTGRLNVPGPELQNVSAVEEKVVSADTVNEDAQKDAEMMAQAEAVEALEKSANIALKRLEEMEIDEAEPKDTIDQIVDAENKLSIPDGQLPKPFDPSDVVANLLKKREG